ncbi:hypothetical protein [Carboxylicivirga sp. N1Y90]|uniref:hypothetical protein n=1 Tax=Carboxylicivirga fragile TaxID=3417571 RepID=UPI003D357C4A|nr:outer membrane beta-barrel protein [Marinilabiliaceae bacterium N1Y90]
MKKTLILFTLVLCAICGNAQGQKGLRELGGSFWYSSESNDEWVHYLSTNVESKSERFAIRPKVGWFLNESSVLGLGLGYEFNKYTNHNDILKTNAFSINPYFRNYSKLSEKFYFTTTVNLTFSFKKGVTNDDTDYKSREYRLAVLPGISYFISEKFAIKTYFGALYYNYATVKVIEQEEEFKSKSNDFRLDFSMDSFGLGASYYF